MPVMDGFELCKTIKTNFEHSHIPVILLTAKNTLQSKIEGLEMGADDYLTKPFSESELLARAKNLITLRQQQLKLKRELEAARAIQASLLPSVPQRFDGIDLDFFYQPSDELSGDFCDILRSGPWVYFYLADVTSHGTASAQVTYLLKEIFSQLIARQASGGDFSLPQLMMETQTRYGQHGLQYDVAIQIARYHLENKSLEMVRGNTPSPLRVGRDASTQTLRVPPSPALSAQSRPELGSFSLRAVQLEPGDAVYFFTDGCYEFEVEGREFGLKRFHEVLSSANSEEWKQSIFDKLVQAKGGRNFPDDLTFFRLRISP
jgi:Serine phosphatase RsbU, regulator of sigma subunit